VIIILVCGLPAKAEREAAEGGALPHGLTRRLGSQVARSAVTVITFTVMLSVLA
jgi:hypothetical protein